MSLKKKLTPPKINFREEMQRGWNLDLIQGTFDCWYATHIAAVFANAVEVMGYAEEMAFAKSGMEPPHDTHRALLIGIEPIEKGIAKDDLVAQLREIGFALEKKCKPVIDPYDLADRIEREGIKL